MIKKYTEFNESLLDKLQGPSKKEVWDNIGYDEYETSEDYFVDEFNSFKKSEIDDYILFKDNTSKILIMFDKKTNDIECYLEYYISFMENMFNLTYVEVIDIIRKILFKELNLKINADIRFI